MNKFIFIILIMVFSWNASKSENIYSLIPRPKAAFEKAGQFGINTGVSILLPKNPNASLLKSVAYFQNQIRSYEGYILEVKSFADYKKGDRVIIIGEKDSDPLMSELLKSLSPMGEYSFKKEGYVLDVSDSLLILAGCDSNGVYNGISTILQMMLPGDATVFVPGCHIFDYPDYADRWVIAFHNLRGQGSLPAIQKILDTMSFRKLNVINHTDFKYSILQEQPAYYFDSANKFIRLCEDRNIGIVPGVMNFGWSSGILFSDPNLAEGIPTTAKYFVESDSGRLIPDSRVVIPNGGFENTDANGKFTSWSFYDEKFATQDLVNYHSGKASAKCTNFDGTNSRFSRSVACQPFRGYVLSAWIKTENFSGGEVRVFAYGQDGKNYRALTFTNLDVPQTSNGWFKVQVYFNTLFHSTVLLYCGVWGANKGTIWWDDFEIKDLGLTNILRRDGCPLTVKNSKTGEIYTEKIDFQEVKDNIMLKSFGEYGPYHQPPKLSIIPGGKIKSGDTLEITSYHPFVAVSDYNCSGSVMACVSEDTTYKIAEDQTRRVNDLLHPKSFFMTHDEIRNMNWDFACQKRRLSPAELLSDNIHKCYDIIKKINKNADVLMWSDMVDSLHNAYNNYYLINGDLTGIWNSIPKDISIVNWNGGKGRESLQWFADQGFRQLTSPYYDDRSTNNIRKWRLAQEGITNVRGMMYTTWASDYSQLTPFSYYAWGAGPAVFFRPPATNEFKNKSIKLSAQIFPDPYDPTDKITDSKVVFRHKAGGNENYQEYSLILKSINEYFADIQSLPDSLISYHIEAQNSQGLKRISPEYLLYDFASGIDESSDENPKINIIPNPVSDFVNIEIENIGNKIDEIQVINMLGETINANIQFIGGNNNFKINLDGLSAGVYLLKIISGHKIYCRKVVKIQI